MLNESKISLHADKKSTEAIGHKWVLLATWAIVLSTVFNFAITFHTPFFKSKASQMPLKRPNQFIGLDKLSYNRSTFQEAQMSSITFPDFIHQVDSTQPDNVLPDSGQLYFSTFGTIAPETRLFLATEEVSTILQFRVRDYGLEHCKIELILPMDLEGSIGQAEHGGHHWQLSGDTHDLEVWSVDANNWLSASTLTYANRPKRLERIGALAVHPGMNVSSHGFPCASDSIQSFELFCISPACRIEILQGKRLPIMGIILRQHSSL